MCGKVNYTLGLTCSPRIFTKLSRGEFGHIFVVYLDDFLYIGQSAEKISEISFFT